jgi:hypothetical protein
LTLEELLMLDFQVRIVMGGLLFVVLVCCLSWIRVRDVPRPVPPLLVFLALMAPVLALVLALVVGGAVLG